MINLMDYLPQYWHDNLEMQQIMRTDSAEMDSVSFYVNSIIDGTFIDTMSEEALNSRWEKPLNILPQGDLEQRKEYILSLLRGTGKLNEFKIRNIVYSITGSECKVTFENSSINIRIANTSVTSLILTVERSLKPSVPAHIGLNVISYVMLWGEVKNRFSSWGAVETVGSWGNLITYF